MSALRAAVRAPGNVERFAAHAASKDAGPEMDAPPGLTASCRIARHAHGLSPCRLVHDGLPVAAHEVAVSVAHEVVEHFHGALTAGTAPGRLGHVRDETGVLRIRDAVPQARVRPLLRALEPADSLLDVR